jgi:cyclase
VELGAGELVVTSINNEGTGHGFDLELTRRIAEAVPVPVIASGGAGELKHLLEVIEQGKADAVSLASVVHYDFITQNAYQAADFTSEGNVEFLKRGVGFSKIQGLALPEIKQYLVNHGIGCRHAQREVANA